MLKGTDTLITSDTKLIDFCNETGLGIRNGRFAGGYLIDQFIKLKKDYKYILLDNELKIRVTQDWYKNIQVYNRYNHFKSDNEMKNYFVKKIRSIKLKSIN